MPEFKAHEERRERHKREELAPFLEAAMQRKHAVPPLADSEIPPIAAYGFTIAQTDTPDEGTRQRRELMRRIAEAARQG